MEEVKLKRSPVNRGALISTDREGLEAYRKRKMAANRINKLESEIVELKSMMSRLLEKLDK